MDFLARPNEQIDFGQGFIDAIIADGSATVVKPLRAFLGDGQRGNVRPAFNHLGPALVADIAHFANILHGRHPGVIDFAAHKIVDDAARKWVIEAVDAFAAERAFLNALTVAAGPAHRQMGQEKVTALINQQAKNFEMLATSDRKGCPAGAVIAFVIDWIQTRPLFDAAALHVGMQPPLLDLPTPSQCRALANDLAVSEPVKRAMAFGSDQLLAQQRGTWHLIAARHTALVAA